MNFVASMLKIENVPLDEAHLICLNELLEKVCPISPEHIYTSHFFCTKLIECGKEHIGCKFFEMVIVSRSAEKFLEFCLGRLYHSLDSLKVAEGYYHNALKGLPVAVDLSRPLGWCDEDILFKGISPLEIQDVKSINSDCFTFNKCADTNTILKSVRQHGVACIDGFYEADYIHALRTELEGKIGRRDHHYRSLNENVNVITLGRMSDDEKSEIPKISETFSSDWMHNIATSFLSSPCKVNYLVFYTHHESDSCNITKVHFDELKGLKYFIYLDDVDEKNGALEVLPGSQNFVKEVTDACDDIGLINFYRPNTVLGGRDGALNSRLYFIRESIRDNRGRWPVFFMDRKLDQGLVPITGAAGTMILFDTHVVHQGGLIQKGRQRSIVRGHCASLSEIKRDDLRYQYTG